MAACAQYCMSNPKAQQSTQPQQASGQQDGMTANPVGGWMAPANPTPPQPGVSFDGASSSSFAIPKSLITGAADGRVLFTTPGSNLSSVGAAQNSLGGYQFKGQSASEFDRL